VKVLVLFNGGPMCMKKRVSGGHFTRWFDDFSLVV
jgi:hypothetical protein